ncbi:MAG: nucleoside phosphorylase [Salibacteraceae bacterium]
MNRIPDSELIINPDGSVYHLHLKPEHIADNIIVVGDPGRVKLISSFFDSIEYQISNREFVTHTGTYKNTRFTVLATGIGTDNIDIVLNELDAAVNIDLSTKIVKNEKRSLNIVRIGTSGALQSEIPVDSFLLSEKAMGFDGLLHFYSSALDVNEEEISKAFCKHANWNDNLAKPYVVSASKSLTKKLEQGTIKGITATASGFYAPQGRVLRLPTEMPNYPEMLSSFSYEGLKVTNFEMETSALYGLSKALGHKAVTLCAIIANRKTKQFSENHDLPIHGLITHVLNNLTI